MNMLVQLVALYTETESHNALRYDRRQDSDSSRSLADHTV